MIGKSLFWKLSRRHRHDESIGVEDFFTETWAYVLKRRPALAQRFVRTLGIDVDGLISVETQVEYPVAPLPGSRTACYPDMRLRGAFGSLLVENKINAQQQVESTDDDELAYTQLERYLAVDAAARVAFVTLGPQEIPANVLANARYLRPSTRPHFVWSEFFSLVADEASAANGDPMVDELLQFMRDLDMVPPRVGVGMIPAANTPDMKPERMHHKRAWQFALDHLKENGWRREYLGLEIICARVQPALGSLLYDQRFRERTGERDGHLKVRLRLTEVRDRGVAVLRRFEALGLEAWIEEGVTSEKQARARTDVIGVTRDTRTEYVGSDTPERGLLRFVRATLAVVHEGLALPATNGTDKDPPPATRGMNS